jgi:uncharacterized membrane protein (Fun14 family)
MLESIIAFVAGFALRLVLPLVLLLSVGTWMNRPREV